MTTIGLLIFAALGQVAKGAEWKPIQPADGAFLAAMPGEVKVASREIPDPQGAFHLDTYSATTDEGAFSILSLRFSGDIPAGTRDVTLDREIGKYLDSRRGQVLREGPVSVDGWPGWDVTIRAPEGPNRPGVVVTRARILLSARTLYTITAASPVGRPLPDSAARFFRSFRFDAKPSIADSTPEKALRTFLGAMVSHDEATLDAVILPVDDLDPLLGGPALKPQALLAARKQAANGAIKALKSGDEVTPAEGPKQVIGADEVGDDRAVLVPPGGAAPTRLRKVEGHWKVDARPWIEARKAADAARAKPKAKPARKPAR